MNGNFNRDDNGNHSRNRNRNPNTNTDGNESGDEKDHYAKRGPFLPEPVSSSKSAGPTCWSADNSCCKEGEGGKGGENAVKGKKKKEDGDGLADITGPGRRGMNYGRGEEGPENGDGNGNGNGGRERHGVGKRTSSPDRRSFSRRGKSRVKGHTNQKLSSASDSLGRRTEATAGAEGTEMDGEKETLLSLFFQPRRERVEGWMDSFWKRHAVLVVVPCLIVRPNHVPLTLPVKPGRCGRVANAFSLLLFAPPKHRHMTGLDMARHPVPRHRSVQRRG